MKLKNLFNSTANNFIFIAVFSLLNQSCGTAPLTDTGAPSQQSHTSPKPDDRADEKKPAFATPPALVSSTNGNNGSQLNLGTSAPEDCATSLKNNWKVGSFINESAPVSFVSISMRSEVVALNGSTVTLKTSIDGPGNDNDINETLTFDACKEPEKMAMVTTTAPCKVTPQGKETVSTKQGTFQADKYYITGCSTSSGKDFNSTVWRVNGAPLWGIVKREVWGKVVPDAVPGNRLSASTQTWSK